MAEEKKEPKHEPKGEEMHPKGTVDKKKVLIAGGILGVLVLGYLWYKNQQNSAANTAGTTAATTAIPTYSSPTGGFSGWQNSGSTGSGAVGGTTGPTGPAGPAGPAGPSGGGGSGGSSIPTSSASSTTGAVTGTNSLTSTISNLINNNNSVSVTGAPMAPPVIAVPVANAGKNGLSSVPTINRAISSGGTVKIAGATSTAKPVSVVLPSPNQTAAAVAQASGPKASGSLASNPAQGGHSL